MIYNDRNNARIKDLNPLYQVIVKKFFSLLEKFGYEFLITDAYRSIAEQNKLYNQGRTTSGKIVTNVKGGYSYHNHRLAMDIVPITSSGKADYNDSKSYKFAGELGMLLGLGWGGSWKGFVDTPHFELTFGLTCNSIMNGAKIPTTINKGQSGNHVKAIQNILTLKGYNTNGIDGSFGDGTFNAVLSFQKDNNLKQTGVIDVMTLEEIYKDSSVNNKPLTKYETLIKLDNKNIYVKTYNDNGTLMVGLRDILEGLNYQVGWSSDGTVTGTTKK